jgi:hypothetical protein
MPSHALAPPRSVALVEVVDVLAAWRQVDVDEFDLEPDDLQLLERLRDGEEEGPLG